MVPNKNIEGDASPCGTPEPPPQSGMIQPADASAQPPQIRQSQGFVVRVNNPFKFPDHFSPSYWIGSPIEARRGLHIKAVRECQRARAIGLGRTPPLAN